MGIDDRDYMRAKGTGRGGPPPSKDLREALKAAQSGWQKEDHLLNRYGPSKFRKWVMIVGLALVASWVLAMLVFQFG